MVFFEDKGLSSLLEAGTVAVEDHLYNVSQPDLDFSFQCIEDGACGQPDEIVRVRQRMGLIEIVDPPDQPSKAVSPGTEAGDMQIAHRQDCRRLVQLGGGFRKELCPPIKCAAEKLKGA